MASSFGLGVIALLLNLLLAWNASGAEPSTLPRDDFWVPDGTVHAVVETNGVLYVGGRFDYISPVSETGQAFDLASGASQPDFPKFAGAIKAILDDGAGGWFVGGLFTSVGGFAVTNLAHIRADRTVDTNWAPNPDDMVLALATDGLRLFVGGFFQNIAGQSRLRLAAIDAASGAPLLNWRADCTSAGAVPVINVLAYSEGRVYVGGLFTFINGIEREQIASLDAATGDVTSWFPNDHISGQSNNHVDALVIADGIVYIGGNFTALGGFGTGNSVNRSKIAALDPTRNLTNSILDWNPDANGTISAIAVTCDTIYVGGSFTHIGGTNRNHIAAIDRTTGRATDWNPGANGDVLRLVLSGNTLYVGGKFSQIGGQPREFLAALDVNTGVPTQWRPRSDFGVAALTLSGAAAITGGALGPGGRVVKNLAALDIRTGRPLDWSVQVGGGTFANNTFTATVNALAAASNTVYLGGSFTEIDGQTRNRLAAVDALSGSLTAWNPGSSGTIETLALSGTNVYAGGRFNTAGGAARTNIAAISTTDGLATTWRPFINDTVETVARQGNIVYVGGRFTSAGGQSHNRLAALDATTGSAVAAFNPNVETGVSTLAIHGSRVYFGGGFEGVSSQPRNHLAAVDSATSSLACWDPGVSFNRTPGVNSLVASGNSLYVGGIFNRVAGQERTSLAVVQTNCPATVSPWNPTVDKAVNALAVARDMVFAGGDFKTVGGLYRPSLAVFPPVGSPVITLQPRSQYVGIGRTVLLEVAATGQAPLSYQWQFNGTNLSGVTSPTLSIPSAQLSSSGEYVLVVTNALGLIHSRPATVTVLQPLTILAQPMSQTVAPGTTVTFSVAVRGNPPPIYQWRLNGVNIPGAVSPTLTITNAQPSSGGSYSVVVANFVDAAISSDIATLVVTSPGLGFADNLIARGTITAASGVGSGSNTGATREGGEPFHVGFRGGRSVWQGWIAPATGIATFSTRGSSFDTLLAIYTNTSAGSLISLAADEDSGEFLTSQASFNAVAGKEYLIAVDGFGGASGNIVLQWSLDTSTVPFPRFLSQPIGLTVTSAASATFSVTVDSPTPATYQWFRECRAIEGATNRTLAIAAVQAADVGRYHVEVRNASTQTARSFDASLDIGPDFKVISQDKLEDLLGESLAGTFGGESESVLTAASTGSGGFVSVTAGSIDSQTVNNTGATTQLLETNHCAVLGGASKWLGLEARSDGVLIVDTTGSAIDTVLAVYHPTNLAYLSTALVTCDNNGAPDGIRSLVRFNATSGLKYLVVVDGVNRAQGAISINWKLGVPPRPGSPSPSLLTLPPDANITLVAALTNGIPPPTYQWFLNGTPIAGGTQRTLTLSNVQPQQAGTYSVLVSNFAGAVMETNAVVAVGSPLRLYSQGTGSDGNYRLSVSGGSGPRFILQAATNLANPTGIVWTSLLTNPITQQPFLFLDTNTSRHRQRFYRAINSP